jgi:hypothetical protein
MAFNVDDVPSWAYSWCFYFMFLGVMSLLTAVGVIFLVNKMGVLVAGGYMVMALVQAATAFTLFWVCRSSLRVTQPPMVQFSH